MTSRIVIVDYGIGNLYSVRRAVEMSGSTDICVSDNAADIANADKVILPGVGAFEDGMRGLRERGLTDSLVDAARSGKPILGICLGMQMLASSSEEFGFNIGLNIIPGEVKLIPKTTIDGVPLKVPFIGWAPVTVADKKYASDSCLRHLGNRAVYLVHSYHVIPHDSDSLLASYDFGGNRITAAIRKNNIIGVQFHPEKSGTAGLEIMKYFVEGV